MFQWKSICLQKERREFEIKNWNVADPRPSLLPPFKDWFMCSVMANSVQTKTRLIRQCCLWWVTQSGKRRDLKKNSLLSLHPSKVLVGNLSVCCLFGEMNKHIKSNDLVHIRCRTQHTLVHPGGLCMFFVVGETGAPRRNLHRHDLRTLQRKAVPSQELNPNPSCTLLWWRQLYTIFYTHNLLYISTSRLSIPGYS